MRFLSLLLISCIVISCKTKEVLQEEQAQSVDSISTVHWMDASNISPILYKAEAEGKMVFLDIYTDWCLPCKMMDEDVFSDKGVGDLLNQDFISYKVDAEKRNGPDLNFLFQVKKYPTLLFLDARGNELTRKEGAAYHSEMRSLIKEAKEKLAQKKLEKQQ